MSNPIVETIVQLSLEDIGQMLDKGIGQQDLGTPELSNQVETTVSTDVGQALDNGVGQLGESTESQSDVTVAPTDIGQTLDNHVGHPFEGTECENDGTIAATDIGHSLDNGVGQRESQFPTKGNLSSGLDSPVAYRRVSLLQRWGLNLP